MINKIIFIGAGNLATHLGEAFLNAGKEILQVYSRTEKSASELAVKLNCSYTTDLEKLLSGADLYIISVADSAIEKIAEMLPFDNVLVAHTSGSTDIKVLKRKNLRPAVFYPLQTFSKNVEVNFYEVPLFLEASDNKDLERLKILAGLISSKVYSIDSQQRVMLHIAAVFACNFTNHMLYIAEYLLKQNNMDFEILKPLISETISKAGHIGPFKAQTGPAARNDKYIIELHSEILSNYENYQKFYNFITNSIISKYCYKKEEDK